MFRRFALQRTKALSVHWQRTLPSFRPFSSQIDASQLTVQLTTSPKEKQPKETLKFGQSFSDHMLEIDWDVDGGWGAPRIKPYGDLSISPAASSLHYALQCFEGMKAYVDDNDNIRLFRPDKNMARMNSSCERLFLPSFNGDAVLECLKKLLVIDKSWIPKGSGYSLYIRPTVISTHPFIGVAAAQKAKLFVICSPVGPYYPTGFAPVKLLADPQNVRAWPGGTGDTKIGGNYAMGIRPGMDAVKKGYSQCLWLFGDDLQVTEVGTMNQFFFWKNKDTGKPELVTAALDGTILPGVTRDSILSLVREWGEFDVVERKYTLHEVMDAVNEGRMIEAFGAGTAAIVSPVNGFSYLGKEYAIPLDASDPSATAGKLTMRLADTIMGIQYGKIESDWSVVVPE
mmetsp:Transcript_1013/g.1339  ORF Transcript_1013/g.1339 Transcript_1013/m.1339 type:complete len:399 (+) Transcript_1013:2-1198(+)